MFNFKDGKPVKRYGRIKRGWHIARIFQSSLNNNRSGWGGQYIKMDFEIIRDIEYRNILVSGFFNCREGGKPDPQFIEMGKAAGLKKDYGNDINSVLRDLIGKELMIFVSHRYKNKRRRERVDDYKSLSNDNEFTGKGQNERIGGINKEIGGNSQEEMEANDSDVGDNTS
jgi:hypothetical protein